MDKKIIIFFAIFVGFAVIYVGRASNKKLISPIEIQTNMPLEQEETGLNMLPHELTIDSLRNTKYQGSDIITEKTLSTRSNYSQYIVSYRSEGLRQYALLTVPKGKKPEAGWPVIIFNHGFIQPTLYKTTERYVSYVDSFARNGYIVMKPDYRGHDNSEGEAAGGYGSNAYTIDVLNAVASIKKYQDADSKRIGMWGHSMGGHITLRAMITTKDIKAGVIWAGVVGSYPDLLNNWRRRLSAQPSPTGLRRRWREELVTNFGTPEENPKFWDSISSTSYLADISGPLQLHHGTADTSVPIEFSRKLAELMKQQNKEVELYVYDGADHNLSNSFGRAMARSVEFFDTHIKNK